jgi:hypothetical protein
MLQSGGHIEVDAQFFLLGDSPVKVSRTPISVLTDEFYVVVTGLYDFFQALFEGQFSLDRPEPD